MPARGHSDACTLMHGEVIILEQLSREKLVVELASGACVEVAPQPVPPVAVREAQLLHCGWHDGHIRLRRRRDERRRAERRTVARFVSVITLFGFEHAVEGSKEIGRGALGVAERAAHMHGGAQLRHGRRRAGEDSGCCLHDEGMRELR